ncbi:hypothetical protein ACFE04_002556 [Oxalis oulophora]
MVSKFMKKSPKKALKDRRSRHSRQQSHRKRSPVKPVTLMDSIKRRLSKFFSKLARIGTPLGCATVCTNRLSHKKKRYSLLTKTFAIQDREDAKTLIDRNNNNPSICRTLFADESRLLPPTSTMKRTIFLDLDETLVHSTADPPPKRYDFVVKPKIDGEMMTFYVLKRPGLDEFLEELSSRYELIVFTAGLREYATLVLDRIDVKGVISHRLYRDSCSQVEGKFVKDLSETGRDLDKVVIVDDNPNSYSLQEKNAVPIKPFISDMRDKELSNLIHFFKNDCCKFEDMRDAVQHYVSSTSSTTSAYDAFEVVL